MSLNPEGGGPTTQSGIYFQNCVSALRLAEMLAQEEKLEKGYISGGRIVSVRAEGVAEVDDTVVVYSTGSTEYIQAKLNISFSGKTWKKLWVHFYKQFRLPTFKRGEGGDLMTLAVQWTESVSRLGSMLEKSRTSLSAEEWLKRLNQAEQGIRENVRTTLTTEGFGPDDEELYRLCRSIYPLIFRYTVDERAEDYFAREVGRTVGKVVSANPLTVFDALRAIIGEGAGGRFQYDYKALVSLLAQRGIRVSTRTPAVFNMPALPNPRFVGRAAELDELHRLLSEGQPRGPAPVGLRGLGGVGKTQLAVEYAYRHVDDYVGGVYWINGAEPLGKGFAAIGRKLRPATADESQDEQVGAAAEELRVRPQALLVIDNLSDPAELTQPVNADLIPAGLPCRILITTRRLDRERFRPVEVEGLPDEHALKLLLRHPSRQPVLDPAHAAHEEALSICAILGNLPLALEIAGAHLGQRPAQPLAVYREQLLALGALPLLDSRAGLSARDSATRHDLAVTATLLSQWEDLKRDDSRLLLKVAGQLTEATPIPIARLGLLSGLYRRTDKFFGPPLPDAVEELRLASFLSESKEGHVRLHPLVCAFARQQVPEGEAAAFRLQCAANLAGAYEELATLEEQAADRGIDSIQDDLIKGYGLLTQKDAAESEPLSQRLLLLLRLVKREIHNLRDVDARQFAAAFLQQIHNRALTLGLGGLAQAAEARLAELGAPHLLLRWRATRESACLERTLVGHHDTVNDVALVAGDRFAVSASADRTLKVWDLITGQVVRTIVAHDKAAKAVAVSPDGRHVVSGSYINQSPEGELRNSEVKVWDANTWQVLRTLDTNTANSVTQVLVTADGERVVASCYGGECIVWELRTGEVVSNWKTRGVTQALCVTPDGRTALSGGSVYEVDIREVKTGKHLGLLENDGGEIYALATTPDGRYVFCAGTWGIISVWDLKQRRRVNRFEAHDSRVTGLRVSQEGRRLFSASSDGTIKVWELRDDMGDAEQVHMLASHSSGVTSLAVNREGSRIVSASYDRTLKLWNLAQTPPQLNGAVGHAAPVLDVSFVGGGRALSVSNDGLFVEWDVGGGLRTRRVGTQDNMRGAAITPDGRLCIAIHGWDLILWELSDGEMVYFLRDAYTPLDAVVITADGRHAVSSCWDDVKTVQVWDLDTGEVRPEPLASRGSNSPLVDSLILTPDERHIIYKWSEMSVRVQDWRTGRLSRSLACRRDGLTALAVTPDGRRVVGAFAAFDSGGSGNGSGQRACALQVWDFDARQELLYSEIDGAALRAVAVTPDGCDLVSVAEDYTLNVWDLESGRRRASITLDGDLTCVAVAEDGESVLTADTAGNVYCLCYKRHGEGEAGQLQARR